MAGQILQNENCDERCKKNFNEAAECRQIVHMPEEFDKKIAVNMITSSNDYMHAKKFRNQLLTLYEHSKKFEDRDFKLTYQDIAHIFDITVELVKYHIYKARLEMKGCIKKKW